ncbi:MAG: sigma-70 family RNA polymerase sigma factor [Bacteroidetes bacterium]|nr:sigma-70 family RNA polymerase sigma factor [Bacteroidota bacterium]
MQKDIIADGVLLKVYLEGNENALETLIKRHKSRIFTSILLLVNDRYLAEDIFQETFIKVINSLKSGKYKHEDKFLPWALRIARNLSIDCIRHRGRIPMISDNDGQNIFDYIKVVQDSCERGMIEKEENISLRKLVHSLPEEQKEVLILRHYADLSFKEIAEITNTNINTCIGRMHYALLNLRRMIKKNPVVIK